VLDKTPQPQLLVSIFGQADGASVSAIILHLPLMVDQGGFGDIILGAGT